MDLGSIAIGNGGWVRLTITGRTEKPFTLVRFALDADELKVRELYLEGPITDRVLKYMNIRALEDLFNFGQPDLGDAVRRRLDLMAPDVRGAASWWSATGSGLPWKITQPRDTSRRVNARLQVPASRPYGDDFYRQVKAVRQELDGAGIPAADAIVEANGVTPSQVYKWFKEVKRREAIGRL